MKNFFHFDQQSRQTLKLRWLFLFLCCASTLGDYYCFDNVGATHDHLKQQFKSQLSPKQFEYFFNLLYSLYSFPNIFLPFFGGILITIFGIRKMYLILGFLIILGQLIFSLGASLNNFIVMIIGRVVFGLGGETINICQTTILVKWFYKNELSFPLGLTLTVSRLGSAFNDILSPLIAHKNNPSNAYWYGFVLCVFSFISISLLCYIDYHKDIEMKERDEVERTLEKYEANESPNEMTFCEKTLKLNSLFWISVVISLFMYGVILPFNYISTDYFITTSLRDMNKNKARKVAGIYMGVPFFIGAIMTPIFGLLIDKFGKRVMFSFSSAILLNLAFVFFFFMNPVLPLVLIGVSYSIFASVIWPSIAIIVNDKTILGFSYGIATSIQNFGLAINPIIVAAIFSSFRTYNACLIYFEILGIVALFLNFGLFCENNRHNSILNKIDFRQDQAEIDEEEKLLKNEQNPVK